MLTLTYNTPPPAKRALVVSQTRAEVREVNEAIRAKLRSNGALVGTEHTVTALEPVDLTAAQKADARFYPPGAVAVLNRGNAASGGGQPGKIVAITAVGVVLKVAGKLRTIRRCDLDRLGIYRPRDLALGKGDRLQLKANAVSADGRKLANGEIVTVADVEESGVIRLEDGRALPPHFRQFVRGYAVTSYGSQGKTVDHVLFADSAARAATNAEQWYVTVSRGRKSVRIFTTDKAQLAASIRRAGHRELALDLGQPPQPQPPRARADPAWRAPRTRIRAARLHDDQPSRVGLLRRSGRAPHPKYENPIHHDRSPHRSSPRMLAT